jgi:hypothetical protein
MNDQCTILLKTHSTYAHLWPIIRFLTQNLANVVVLIDDNIEHNFEHRVIRYNPLLKYTKRLSFALSQIETDKVLLIHDVDLILNLDLTKLSSLLETFCDHDIDRLSLGVFFGKEIIQDRNNTLCRLYPHMSANFMTPFDYAPSIYKTHKLLELVNSFDETYSNFELRNDVQDFVNRNFRSFGLQKTSNENLIYHRGFVYSKDFNFLHITVKGKFLPLHFYYDLQPAVKDLIAEYDLLKHIEINHTHGFIPKNTL